MMRAVVALFSGLLLGGIIHIAIVLAVPYYAEADAFAQVRELGRSLRFHTLPALRAGVDGRASLDPRMAHAVCWFDLSDGPLAVAAEFPDEFWSAAVFDRRGRNVYSLNDGSVDGSRLDLAIITPVQMALLRQNPPESLETSIVVEHAMDEGFVLLRVFMPDQTAENAASSALATASCAHGL